MKVSYKSLFQLSMLYLLSCTLVGMTLSAATRYVEFVAAVLLVILMLVGFLIISAIVCLGLLLIIYKRTTKDKPIKFYYWLLEKKGK